MSVKSLSKSPTTETLSSPLDIDPYAIPDHVIGEEIGHGSFGQLRYCTNLNTREIFAVKLEPMSADIPQLYREYKLYMKFHDNNLNKTPGLPMAYYYGEVGNKYRVLVMDLLGPNLHNLFLLCNKVFTLKTVVLIACQLLKRIEYLHNKEYLYRDVKPQNFLIGRRCNRTENMIFVVDFGLSKEYIDEHGEHIPYREKKALTGTARYMSIRTHEGIEQSRRDDLEGLGYLFIYFLKGSLPWQNIKTKKDANSKEKYKKIAECKKKTTIEKLCENTPKEFTTYMKYVRKLEFQDKPNYEFLQGLFTAILKRNDWTEDGLFDWVEQRNAQPSPIPSTLFNYAPLPELKEGVLPGYFNISNAIPQYANEYQKQYYAPNNLQMAPLPGATISHTGVVEGYVNPVSNQQALAASASGQALTGLANLSDKDKYANPYLSPYGGGGKPIAQYTQYFPPELLSSSNSVVAEDLSKSPDKKKGKKDGKLGKTKGESTPQLANKDTFTNQIKKMFCIKSNASI